MTPHSITDFRFAASTLSAGSIGSAPVWQLGNVLQEDASRRRDRAPRLASRRSPAAARAELPSGAPGWWARAVCHRMFAGVPSLLKGLATRLANSVSHDMKRRSFLLSAFVALSVVMQGVGGASAAQIRPPSWITVEVVSVERESSNRDGAIEYNHYLAKARIIRVLQNEGGVVPGAVIDIRYTVQEPRSKYRDELILRAGETVTLDVRGQGSSFTWRNWLPQPRTQPPPPGYPSSRR